MKKDRKNTIFSDLELQALVDGALPPDQQILLMTRIENSPDALQQLQLLKDQKELLRRWWHEHKK